MCASYKSFNWLTVFQFLNYSSKANSVKCPVTLVKIIWHYCPFKQKSNLYTGLNLDIESMFWNLSSDSILVTDLATDGFSATFKNDFILVIKYLEFIKNDIKKNNIIGI